MLDDLKREFSKKFSVLQFLHFDYEHFVTDSFIR